MSYTPGPWFVVDELTVKGGEYRDRKICDVHHDFKRRGKDGAALWENSKANANLIAAAPDMYGALQTILDDDLPMRPASICLAQQALAKAEGKT